MHQNIKAGSDNELIFRVRELSTGNRISIAQEDTDYWDYPLTEIHIQLTNPEFKTFVDYAITILPGETTEEITGILPITIESWDDGIISIKLESKYSVDYPTGSFFAIMDLHLSNPDFSGGIFRYTINDYPLYIGEIIEDES